ncbi:hypothetical protein [Candidatus Vidania fulgoroideorum]
MILKYYNKIRSKFKINILYYDKKIIKIKGYVLKKKYSGKFCCFSVSILYGKNKIVKNFNTLSSYFLNYKLSS